MSKEIKKIINHDWVKVWTTKYSFFNLYLFVQGYITQAYKNTGKGFDHILFSYKDGLATVYRVSEELKKLSIFYAERAINDLNYLKNSVSKLYELIEGIESVYKCKNIFEDLVMFKKLRSDLVNFLPYYLVMIWTADGLKDVKTSEGVKKKISAICLEARHKTEFFYLNLEKFITTSLKELDNEESLGFGEYILTLTPDEIEACIVNRKFPDKKSLVDRWNSSVIFGDNNGIDFFAGEKVHAILSEIDGVDKDITEFKGTVAMKGISRGKVKIIFTDKDMQKFYEGDILVTTMTRPEWISVMQKSIAFITDAGGVLSHAAIVAREMKKPCIIGTKIATKVLKDGDFVEVDADRGIVRIIK